MSQVSLGVTFLVHSEEDVLDFGGIRKDDRHDQVPQSDDWGIVVLSHRLMLWKKGSRGQVA
jgi:hypothetical protein